MHYLIKEIIEAYIEDIDNNEFKDLYNTLNEYITHEQLVPLLTEALLTCGINPLDHLEYVPEYYMYDTDKLKTLSLREGIKSIGVGAFGEISSLNFVRLPASCKHVAAYAFANCYNLKKVIIDCPDTQFNNSAFYGATEITEIFYRGSKDQWYRLVHQVSEFQAPGILIHCSDGDLRL